MILVCDEGVERPVIERLRQDGHEVAYIAELVFRQRKATSGVVLLRLAGLSHAAKADAVAATFAAHAEEIHGSFTVISAGHIRVRKGLPPA